MHYTKPTVVRAEEAIIAIQRINQTGCSTNKTVDRFHNMSLCNCTAAAYEPTSK